MGQSPSLLLETVKNRDVQQFNAVVPKISQIGLDINFADEEGKTALHWASSLGEIDMISALLDAGADAEKQDVQGCPPLISAVFMGQARAAELLLEKGKVSIDKANKDGMTALHWAIVEKRFECIDLLIKKGCSLEAKNNKGQTPNEIVSRLKPKHRSRMEQFIFSCIERHRPNSKTEAPRTLSEPPKTSVPEKNDTNARVRRLVVLCKVWGLVKFMHPFLSYKNIDWDSALLRTIPKLNAASSTLEYQNTINELLSTLEDPNTYCYAPDNSPKKSIPIDDQEQPIVKFTEDGVGILVVTHHEKFIDYQHKMIPLINSFKEVSSAKSKSIVFDIRLRKGNNINASSYPFKFMFFEGFRSTLLNKELNLPAYRQRMMTGFPQFRNFGNIFHSGVSVTEADKVEPNVSEQLPKRNIVFIINKGTPDTLVDLAVALQVAGIAKIVLEKQANEPNVELGISTFQVNIGENLVVNIRKNERVNGDGSIGLIPDVVLTIDNDSKTDTILETAINIARESTKLKPVSRQIATPYISKTIEKEYGETSYPSLELRILGLFRFWNIVNYFFPYKSLIEKSWDEILIEFIPKIENAKNDTEYHLAIAELVATCGDSHSSTSSNVIQSFIGNFQPPIDVKFIEGKTIVVYLYDPTLQSQGLSIGDEVIGFEKEDIEERKKKLQKILPASTKQALQLKIHQKLLSGDKDSNISIKIKSSNDGQVRVINLKRSMPPMTRPPIKPTYGVLPEGVGFIDTVNLAHGDFEKAFETIKSTPALILDIRGYPKGTIYQLAPRLTDKKVTVAITQTPFFLPSMIYSELESCFIEEKHKLQPSASPQKYRGKIIALVNEETISHAEHSCLYLSACTDVTFIGTPTNGANGNVTNCALPGGILIGFTGLGTLHANNSQLQRKGIQPHVLVEPTVEGLRKNIDEIMMRAIDFATKRP